MVNERVVSTLFNETGYKDTKKIPHLQENAGFFFALHQIR